MIKNNTEPESLSLCGGMHPLKWMETETEPAEEMVSDEE